MKQYCRLALLVSWMCVIFFMSAKPADESSKMSLTVGRFIGNVVISGYGELSKEQQEQFAIQIEHAVRKTAHLAEYAVLGLLLSHTFYGFGKCGKGGLFFSILCGAGYAVTDEVHQLFVPGRSGQITDVMIDASGVVLGACVYFVIWKYTTGRQKEA